jgi:hypothetical protein
MKTVLLTLVALVVSAQPVEVYYNPPILPECYTGKWLNGVWWTRSNPMERWAYLSALTEATGHKIRLAENVYQVYGFPLTMPVVDVIKRVTTTADSPH